MPRDFPPPHPDAVATLADVAVEWIEARMAADSQAEGDALLWWQWLVLQRALEVRPDGTYCWPLCLVTVSRQQGKTVLLAELALWRIHHAAEFGEPQVCLHAARNAGLANLVQDAARTWAEEQGYRVTRRIADSVIELPDRSAWRVCSLRSVWGQRVSQALLDEAWDMSPEAFWLGLWPTMASRKMRQAWAFSASNTNDRGLLRSLRDNDYCMTAAWGADRNSDYQDPQTWRDASPDMNPGRMEAMKIASKTPSFEVEWLNVDVLEAAVSKGWPEGFAGCIHSSPTVVTTGIAALEMSSDGRRYGVAYAQKLPDGAVQSWTRHFETLAAAVEDLNEADPPLVLVGAGLVDRVAGVATFHHVPAGMAETRLATPVYANLVRRGLVRHDHDGVLLMEVLSARAIEVETGMLLSAKRSLGSIAVLKATMWAAWAVESGLYDQEESAIY